MPIVQGNSAIVSLNRSHQARLFAFAGYIFIGPAFDFQFHRPSVSNQRRTSPEIDVLFLRARPRTPAENQQLREAFTVTSDRTRLIKCGMGFLAIPSARYL